MGEYIKNLNKYCCEKGGNMTSNGKEIFLAINGEFPLLPRSLSEQYLKKLIDQTNTLCYLTAVKNGEEEEEEDNVKVCPEMCPLLDSPIKVNEDLNIRLARRFRHSVCKLRYAE